MEQAKQFPPVTKSIHKTLIVEALQTLRPGNPLKCNAPKERQRSVDKSHLNLGETRLKTLKNKPKKIVSVQFARL